MGPKTEDNEFENQGSDTKVTTELRATTTNEPIED